MSSLSPFNLLTRLWFLLFHIKHKFSRKVFFFKDKCPQKKNLFTQKKSTFLFMFIFFFFYSILFCPFRSTKTDMDLSVIIGSTTDATELSTWNIRFDVRMLATQWNRSAEIPRNSFVLTTKKFGLQTNQHVTILNGSTETPKTSTYHQHLQLNTPTHKHTHKKKVF